MAVGKGSMARASKAAKPACQEGRTAVKSPRTATGAAVEETAGKIVYQSSYQMLDRDALPGEIFGIGDAMPVYFF
ncbi:MAG: hypothetical protein ACI4DQ_11500 [Lachnospiraceae bacterium]